MTELNCCLHFPLESRAKALHLLCTQVYNIYGCLCSLSAFLEAQMVKNLPTKAGDTGLILVLGRSLGEGHSYTLHYSCLENSTDRGTTVHGVAKSQTYLSN